MGDSDDERRPKAGIGKTDILTEIMMDEDEETDGESDPEFVDPKNDGQDDTDQIG